MRLLKSLYLDIIGLFLPGVWIHATLQNIFSLSWMTGVGYVALYDFTTAWWGFFILMTCSFFAVHDPVLVSKMAFAYRYKDNDCG